MDFSPYYYLHHNHNSTVLAYFYKNYPYTIYISLEHVWHDIFSLSCIVIPTINVYFIIYTPSFILFPCSFTNSVLGAAQVVKELYLSWRDIESTLQYSHFKHILKMIFELMVFLFCKCNFSVILTHNCPFINSLICTMVCFILFSLNYS